MDCGTPSQAPLISCARLRSCVPSQTPLSQVPGPAKKQIVDKSLVEALVLMHDVFEETAFLQCEL